MDDIARRHNEKMKRIKEARDKIMATKTEERGLINGAYRQWQRANPRPGSG